MYPIGSLIVWLCDTGFQGLGCGVRQEIVTVQPSVSLLRNLPIPNRLRRGADSFLAKLMCLYGLCSKCKVLG